MSISNGDNSSMLSDLLEPQHYPDPSTVKTFLSEYAFKNQVTGNKATLRAIAPYLQVFSVSQKKKIQSAVSRSRSFRRTVDMKFRRKPKEQTKSVRSIPNVVIKPELIKSIEETAESLERLIRCNRIVIYLVDPAKNEIFQNNTSKRFKIELGSVMAAYSAYTKHHVMSENVRGDQRFPLGVGIQDTTIKFGLCVPVKTPDGNVIALFELIRDVFDVKFNQHDSQFVMTITSWIGVAVLQHSNYKILARQDEICNYLQELNLHYSCDKVNSDKAISDIIVLARETIGAERCDLYVVVGRHSEALDVEEYTEDPHDSKLLRKKLNRTQLKLDGNVPSRAIDENQTINILKDSNYVLCVPVVCTCNEVIGAIQLRNSRSRGVFDEEDEKTLQIFASYLPSNLYFLSIVDKNNKLKFQDEAIKQMLYHHFRPTLHDQEAINWRSPQIPENLFTFSWYPSPDDTPRLAELTLYMFQKVLGSEAMLKNDFPTFILTVKNCYRPNAYHNFLHAFVVTHAMANIVSRNNFAFNGIERTALMVAALCHDIDHRGYTNNFVSLTKHYLSILYETSPLENHHFQVAKMVIERCSMFRYLTKDIYNQLIQEIHKCILATDLALYFQSRTELGRIADRTTFSFKDPDHRGLVKSLLMTVCDLSGQSKPIDISMKVTEDLYEEFFQQGDAEKKMGYAPLPSMDRNKGMILENQVQFMNVVVLPCVEIVARIFTSVSPLLEDTKTTLNKWKEMLLKYEKTKELLHKWKRFADEKRNLNMEVKKKISGTS